MIGNIYIIVIIVGLYGSIHDKDYDAKLRILREIRNNLDEGFIYEGDIFGDNYYATLASNRKVLSKKYGLSR